MPIVHVGSTPERAIVLKRGLAIAVMVVLAIPLIGWGMGRPVPMDRDAENYAQVTLLLRGESVEAAALGAARARCGSLDRTHTGSFYQPAIDRYFAEDPTASVKLSDPAYTAADEAGRAPTPWVTQCTVYLVAHPMAKDPRYNHIFESRPLFPGMAALLAGWLGIETSLRLLATLGVAASGILLAATGRLCGLSWPAAILGQGALYLSLFGYWGTRPFAEGVTGALTALLLFGVCLATRPQRRTAIAIQIIAAALLVPTKSYAAVLVGAGILAALAVLRVIRRDLRVWPLTPGPVLAVAAGLIVPPLVGWARVTDSLQDLATNHFRRHDVANPWKGLLYALRKFLGEFFHGPGTIGLAVLVIAVVVAALVLVPKPAAWAAILGPTAVGLGAVLTHPLIGPSARLFSSAWAGIILAAAIVADLVVRRLLSYVAARRSPG